MEVQGKQEERDAKEKVIAECQWRSHGDGSVGEGIERLSSVCRERANHYNACQR